MTPNGLNQAKESSIIGEGPAARPKPVRGRSGWQRTGPHTTHSVPLSLGEVWPVL